MELSAAVRVLLMWVSRFLPLKRFPSDCQLFLFLFLFRLLNALLIKTYLYPDEWWQSGEVAHRAVFGYGYLTWDWRGKIRSWLFPLPLVLFNYLGKLMGVDDWSVRYGGAVMMATYIALTDLFTAKLAFRVFQDRRTGGYALLFSVFNSFHASRSVRTLSNNAEMALSCVALYFWPALSAKALKGPGADLLSKKFLLSGGLIGLACLMRATTIQFWISPVLLSATNFVCQRQFGMLFRMAVVGGLLIPVVVLVGGLIDGWGYGLVGLDGKTITLTWWNFYRWNVVEGISHLYGREPFVYHFRHSLPLMLTTGLGHFLLGLLGGAGRLSWMVGGYLLISSLQVHKEVRFLAPLLPILIIFMARGASQAHTFTMIRSRARLRLLNRLWLFGVLGSQLPIAWFYARIHLSGGYEILNHLRSRIDAEAVEASVFFLLPSCHLIPQVGYLHRKLKRAAFVPCHPPLVDYLMTSSVVENRFRDEFATDARLFAKTHVFTNHYSHIVMYSSDLDRYLGLIEESGFRECARVSRGAVEAALQVGSNRRLGELLLLCRASRE